MKRHVTMKDVAKLAGVSQPTVSNVINGTSQVTDEVFEKVQKAIRELGYVPNALAKSLKQNKTNTVGMLIPDIENGYYSEIAKEVEQTLRENGYFTFLCNTFYKPELEKLYINTLIQNNVSGIIMCYGLVDKSVFADIANFDIPLVCIDDRTTAGKKKIPSVEINNVHGSKLAVEHLYSIGARRICFASEPLYNTALESRHAGFVTALNEYGMDSQHLIEFIEKSEYGKIDMGYNLGAKILLNMEIDAVFASNDYLAIGIMKRLADHGVKIPDDIVIMGYDDVLVSKLVVPSLTTISQPKRLMAKRGTQKLITIMKGNEVKDMEISMEPTLIIRDSTMKKGQRPA
jgi:LacI family transcriptional regulator